jgi:hypothetical protein
MQSIKLTEYGKNNTIEKQINRGRGKGFAFDSEKFREDNRISIDITNIFNAPGNNPITRGYIEAIIPDAINAHKMLLENRGDIMDNNIPMTGLA